VVVETNFEEDPLGPPEEAEEAFESKKSTISKR
jgi:hypothetical protein